MEHERAPKKPAPAEPVPEPGPLPGSVAPRAQGPGARPRCVLCHDDVLVAALRCPDCGVTTHADCMTKQATCPTLGCARPAAELLPVREVIEPRQRPGWSRILLATLVALFLMSGLIVGGLRLSSFLADPGDVTLLGPHTTHELVEALADPRPDVQRRADEALRTLGDGARPAVPALSRLVREQRGDVERNATLLAELDPQVAGALFADLLRGPFGRDRLADLVLPCSRLTGPPALRQALGRFGEDRFVSTSLAYAYAHASLYPQRAVELILDRFYVTTDGGRQQQALGELSRLAELGTAETRRQVRAALEQIAAEADDASVRAAARERLEQLGDA